MPSYKSAQENALLFVSLPSLTILLPFLIIFPSIRCNLQNVTCDDDLGCDLPGGVEGATTLYIPDGGWAQGAVCTGCKIHPDPSQAFDGSWHDTTLNKGIIEQRLINITFQGKWPRTALPKLGLKGGPNIRNANRLYFTRYCNIHLLHYAR